MNISTAKLAIKNLAGYVGIVIVDKDTSKEVSLSSVYKMAKDLACDVKIDGDNMLAQFHCLVNQEHIGTLFLLTGKWQYCSHGVICPKECLN